MSHLLIQMFNDIAPTYDLLNHVLSLNVDRWWRRIALQAIDIQPTSVILDVCTGTADIAIGIAEKYPTAKVYGVDIAEQMLKIGWKKILKKRFDQNIDLITADALQLPFPNNAFDILCVSFGLRNLRNRNHGIQEMYRVLKKNGQLMMLEFAPPKPSFWGYIYRVYLHNILPIIGGIVSQSVSAYHYLASSIEHFPASDEILRLLEDTGFQVSTCKPVMFGIVSLYIAHKK